MEIGDKVHYSTDYDKAENGIVKAIHKSGLAFFVVYKCGGDWGNYQNYTGALTDIEFLKEGWVNDNVVKAE